MAQSITAPKKLVDDVVAAEASLIIDPDNKSHRRTAAAANVELADSILQNDNDYVPEVLEQALPLLLRALELMEGEDSLNLAELYYRVGAYFHYFGMQKECLWAMSASLDIREKIAKEHPFQRHSIKFFSLRCPVLTAIGHLCNEPETFIKEGVMGWRPPVTAIINVPKEIKVVNSALLNYWRKYICVVTDTELSERLKPLAKIHGYDTFWRPVPPRPMTYMWDRYLTVQKAWQEQGRGPLLEISPQHEADGRKCLEKLGIPREGWFVTLHVRDQSQGKFGQAVNARPTSNRDANIDSYRLAVEAIHSHGGFVVRLGDISMRPAPDIPGLIDYIHTPYRADWMDLFLIARSKFFLGTSSGPNGIPPVFGVPSLLTNVAPTNVFALCKDDLYVPKLLWSEGEQRFLTLDEMLSKPWDWCFNMHLHEHLKVYPKENSPEELRDAVEEMIARLSGNRFYSPQEEALQQRFQTIAAMHQPGGIQCRIGSNFVCEHQEILFASEAATISSPLHQEHLCHPS